MGNGSTQYQGSYFYKSLEIVYTLVDKKVLKLAAYLLKYTTELHQTSTDYVVTISLFVNGVTMT